MIFGRRVRESRQRRGLTQAELADLLAMDQSAIARLESGKRTVSIDDLFAAAAALAVPPVHLLVPLEDDAPVQITRKGNPVPAPIARAWIRGEMSLGDVRWADLPRSELRRMVKAHVTNQLTNGMNPLAASLTRAKLSEEAEHFVDEIVDAMRNPKEDEDDG